MIYTTEARSSNLVESLKLFFVLDLLHEAVGMYKERIARLAGDVQETGKGLEN